MRQNVMIIGAGALGKCIAGILADQASITVYERNTAARRVLKNGGFILNEKKRTQKVNVRSVMSPDELQGEKTDILIFATKVMDLRQAVADAAGLDPQCVFFPQNGIFDIRWTKRFFKRAKICRGVTTMACQEEGLGHATLFFRGNMYLGGGGAPMVASLFRKSGIKVKIYRDFNGPIWSKLIFSAVMNPLPVVTGQGYDILLKDQDVWKLVKQAIEEGRNVAKSVGVRLAFDPLQLIYRVRNGDLAGIEHRGSIVHDMRARRTTELDFITGALVRQARKVGVKTPVLNSILSKSRLAGA